MVLTLAGRSSATTAKVKVTIHGTASYQVTRRKAKGHVNRRHEAQEREKGRRAKRRLTILQTEGEEVLMMKTRIM